MDHEIGNHPVGSQWFAVWTRSRQEKTAASMLESLGVSHFLPLRSEVRQWSDRKQVIAMPLFPGYLFVHIERTAESQLSVRKVPGIVKFVGNHSGPLAIPENEVENLRAIATRGNGCSPHPFLRVGDLVRVVRGPFSGIEGIFVRCGAQTRVVVSVEIIQRAVSVEVSGSDVEQISRPLARTPRMPIPLTA
jgi:transcriptional antiterminator NusG